MSPKIQKINRQLRHSKPKTLNSNALNKTSSGNKYFFNTKEVADSFKKSKQTNKVDTHSYLNQYNTSDESDFDFDFNSSDYDSSQESVSSSNNGNKKFKALLQVTLNPANKPTTSKSQASLEYLIKICSNELTNLNKHNTKRSGSATNNKNDINDKRVNLNTGINNDNIEIPGISIDFFNKRDTILQNKYNLLNSQKNTTGNKTNIPSNRVNLNTGINNDNIEIPGISIDFLNKRDTILQNKYNLLNSQKKKTNISDSTPSSVSKQNIDSSLPSMPSQPSIRRSTQTTQTENNTQTYTNIHQRNYLNSNNPRSLSQQQYRQNNDTSFRPSNHPNGVYVGNTIVGTRENPLICTKLINLNKLDLSKYKNTSQVLHVIDPNEIKKNNDAALIEPDVIDTYKLDLSKYINTTPVITPFNRLQNSNTITSNSSSNNIIEDDISIINIDDDSSIISLTSSDIE